MATQDRDWKTPVIVVGGAVGFVTGLLTAYLYTRTADDIDSAPPARIGTMEALRVSLAALTLVRQISELGGRKGKNKDK